MQCLDDSDDSIRLRALDLLYGMVSKKNLMEIVKKLMAHMEKAEGTTYRDELMHKTIQICSQNDYQVCRLNENKAKRSANQQRSDVRICFYFAGIAEKQ